MKVITRNDPRWSASGVRSVEGGRDICVRLHVQDGATRDMDALLQLEIVGGRRRQVLVSASAICVLVLCSASAAAPCSLRIPLTYSATRGPDTRLHSL